MRSAPPSSNQAIEPPPAPIVWMSAIGNRIGTPPTTDSAVTCALPPRTAATSVLVPPMSNVSTSRARARPATNAEPATPAAGPERTHAAGRSAAVAASTTPPDDCITSGGGSISAR